MANEKPLDTLSLAATASLATKQYYAVKLDVSNDRACVICAVAGERVTGILQNAPIATEEATVMTQGMTSAIAGGTIVRGAALATMASGLMLTAVPGDQICGYALESASVNEHFSMYLNGPGQGKYEDGYSQVAFFIVMTSIADGDLFNFTPPFAGTIEKIAWTQGTAVTTGAKLSTLSCEIAGVGTTGGALALTSAACTPIGKRIDGTALTALNAFDGTEEVTIIAASTTSFIEGDGHVIVTMKRQ